MFTYTEVQKRFQHLEAKVDHSKSMFLSGVCRRAMASLLDILQGHQPEELSREPSSVIDPMFDILLELASASEGSTNDHVRPIAKSPKNSHLK